MLGSELTQVVAAFAFVLTPRITTLRRRSCRSRSGRWRWRRGSCSRWSAGRSRARYAVRPRSARSWSACCGGVNAVAVAAVLPARRDLAADPRARPAPVAAAGLVDAVHGARHRLVERAAAPARPLRAAVPRLHRERHDHHPPDRPDPHACSGVSDWVAYFGGPDFQAGLARRRRRRSSWSTPPRSPRSGWSASCLPGNPHRRFLVWGLLAGVVLVGFGYARDLPGLLRGGPDASRSTSRWPRSATSTSSTSSCGSRWSSGLAHALAELPKLIRAARLGGAPCRVYRVAVAVLAVWSRSLTPWLYGVIAPRATGSHAGPDVLARRRRATSPTTTTGRSPWSCPPRRSASTPGATSTTTCCRGWPRAPGRCATWSRWPSPATWCSSTRSRGPSSPARRSRSSRRTSRRTASARSSSATTSTGSSPAHPTRRTCEAVLAETPGITLVRSFGPPVGSGALRLRRQPARRTRGSSRTSGISDVTPARSTSTRCATPSAAARHDPGEVLLGDPSSAARPRRWRSRPDAAVARR